MELAAHRCAARNQKRPIDATLSSRSIGRFFAILIPPPKLGAPTKVSCATGPNAPLPTLERKFLALYISASSRPQTLHRNHARICGLSEQFLPSSVNVDKLGFVIVDRLLSFADGDIVIVDVGLRQLILQIGDGLLQSGNIRFQLL